MTEYLTVHAWLVMCLRGYDASAGQLWAAAADCCGELSARNLLVTLLDSLHDAVPQNLALQQHALATILLMTE